MGCGTSYGKSTVLEGIPEEEQPYAISRKFKFDDVEETVYFSRAEGKECYITLNLVGNKLEVEEKDTIGENIKESLVKYINNLGIHIDVLFSGVAKVIYNIQTTSGYEDFVFDITDIKIGNTENPQTTRLPVDIYEYAKISSKDNITINWE